VAKHSQTDQGASHDRKMAALERLAGGVAHDLNNALTAILGYSELALADMDADHPLRRHLEQIHQAGRTATSMTMPLLAFSRRQRLQPHHLDLSELVRSLVPRMRQTVGGRVKVVVHLDPEPAFVSVDSDQLIRAVLQLASNARDAMPLGGTLTIETANAASATVVLTVTDTGAGMDDHVLAHIFEPFFTTKPCGKGKGLGLPMVYGIVMQSGGLLSVQSVPDRGTTVRVCLPGL